MGAERTPAAATSAGGAGRQERDRPLCPSAQPEMDGCTVFGVVGGPADAPRLSYLRGVQPVTDDLLALAEPVRPTEVFRFAAPCVAHECAHFVGGDCGLVQRAVRRLPVVTSVLPPCQIRRSCRWWQQEGAAACRRCPQVVTTLSTPSEIDREVATPPQRAGAGGGLSDG